MSHRDDTQMMGDQVHFPTTSWTLVRSSQNLKALGSLVSVYWKPLYFFVRQQGYPNETAKDIVQDFLKTMMERGSLRRADPARGRFRTFLLASLSNFLKDRAKAESRLKRGGNHTIFSLDFSGGEADFVREASRGESPETILNRAWASSLWRHALDELKGDPLHLEAFRGYLSDESYATICARTGLSEAAAKTAVHRLKGQLRDVVLSHLRQTAASEEDLESELAEFLALLR
jgi:RNA polymerase sigma-70 factor (ECF subfamily)